MSQALGSSFRDPSGFLFTRDGNLYRQINRAYADDYDLLMGSGLYTKLVKEKLLIAHDEVTITPADSECAFKVIQPNRVAFISYPYEWSFSQYKDAALTTLRIQRIALKHGMSLKDASAYNIQFHNGRAALIDTLSFEKYDEGKPWVPYRQFCQHFLAPLALMSHRDIRLNQWMRVSIDGVPLDLASSLLPLRTRFNMPLLLHIHLHAASQKRFSSSTVKTNAQSFSKASMLGLIDSLESGVKNLAWNPQGTEWGDYYDATNYSREGIEHKEKLVAEFLDQAQPKLLWDMGANNAHFSRIASGRGIKTIAFDIDPAAVEKGYRDNRKDENLLPLLLDLTNPSPALGWAHAERDALLDRAPADAVMALALIHHLAISNNVPLPRVADFFADAGKWLIIEFVPKEDSQVQRLLATRKDIFPDYSLKGFEAAFAQKYKIQRVEAIKNSARQLYLMERK